jgi:molybdate transport system ATP-binding protein
LGAGAEVTVLQPPPGVEGRFRGRLGAFELDAEVRLPARGLVALSGPSGSGKTTLIRCIAGLTRLDGRLTVTGETWQDGRRFLPAHKRPVGLVFQDASLLPHLSVRGNLAFGWKRAKGPRHIAWDEAVELLGLAPLLDRNPQTLSGGEKQRAALGRALLSQPRLLLMDEPLSSLDAESKADILPYLDRLHRALAIPAVYVSHDAAEIARLADRVLLMRDGRVSEGPVPGGLDAARAQLAALSPDDRERLALAALAAGLRPLE